MPVAADAPVCIARPDLRLAASQAAELGDDGAVPLDRGALQVERQAPQRAEFLAAAGAAGPAVHAQRQHGPGPERLALRLLAADPDAAVPGRQRRDRRVEERAVVRVDAGDEPAAAAV